LHFRLIDGLKKNMNRYFKIVLIVLGTFNLLVIIRQCLEINQSIFKNLTLHDHTSFINNNATRHNIWRSRNKKIKILLHKKFDVGVKPLHKWSIFNKPDKTKECGCNLDECEVTDDLSQFSKSDIVIFHGIDRPSLTKLKQMYKTRMPNQLWVYQNREPPFAQDPDFEELEQLFNLSVTYRLTADFPRPYGRYLKKTREEIRKYQDKNYAIGKTKQVAWIVSNCGMIREKLADIIQKSDLSLEVGGKCKARYRKKIYSKQEHNKLVNLKAYKFYFAAENNLCDNYITEKYWRNAFQNGAVPITLGGSNYSDPRLAIPGSYINALDFKTPQDLIRYIKKVDNNDTLYNELFKWKKKFKIFKEKEGCNTFLCDVCSKLQMGIKLKTTKLSDEINRQKECGKHHKYYMQWIYK